MNTKRRTGAECIAFFLGWNYTDVTDMRYQAKRSQVAVYTIGDSYMCCPPVGGKPPAGWNWLSVGEAYGRRIYKAEPEAT